MYLRYVYIPTGNYSYCTLRTVVDIRQLLARDTAVLLVLELPRAHAMLLM